MPIHDNQIKRKRFFWAYISKRKLNTIYFGFPTHNFTIAKAKARNILKNGNWMNRNKTNKIVYTTTMIPIHHLWIAIQINNTYNTIRIQHLDLKQKQANFQQYQLSYTSYLTSTNVCIRYVVSCTLLTFFYCALASSFQTNHIIPIIIKSKYFRNSTLVAKIWNTVRCQWGKWCKCVFGVWDREREFDM